MGKQLLEQETKLYPDIVEIENKQIKYVREVPRRESIVDPVLLLRGYFANHRDYALPRHALAQMGVEAITMQAPLGMTEADAASAVISHLASTKDRFKINLVPQSLGSTTAVEVAEDVGVSPFLNAVVFVAPACLADHNLLQMTFRTGHFLRGDLLRTSASQCRTDPKRFALDSLSRFIDVSSDPGRIWREGKQAATGNIQDKIQSTRDKNIKTAALQFEVDPYSPPTEARAAKYLFDLIRVIPGDHLTMQREPAKVAEVLIEIFTELDSLIQPSSKAA